ncbi:hypothetical protein RsTz2092_00850 [Deferribacterales bacterium RsTz2092]|nr:hypothetical protein AGMMS49941_00750 [Deferribacterales bacterium]
MIKGKKLLKTFGKYYIVYRGLRYFLLGSRQIDTGRILENVRGCQYDFRKNQPTILYDNV